MKRCVIAAVAAAALVLSLPASALPAEIAITNNGSVSPPSCPANPCAVISRTTALQVKDGSDSEPFTIHHSGRIVSWSVALAAPSTEQIHYFDEHEGGTARASLAVLRNKGGLDYALVALSPLVHLQPYFGRTAVIPLADPITVHKGDVIALAVQTWLPALALNYPATTAWRASRSAAQCSDVAIETAQSVLGSSASYDCLYQTAQITYGASEATGS
jgi:hypothetical protein